MGTTASVFVLLLCLIALVSVPIAIALLFARRETSANALDAAQPTQPTFAPPRPDPQSPYERIPALLSAAEQDFFAVLGQAVPSGYQIFAQLRLANLVQVKPWARRDKSHWWRIQAKCLDFVLVDAATYAPRLVVELDDASHNRADRRERDAFVDDVLAAAGIPILHVRWQRRYDARALADQLAVYLGVAAPDARLPDAVVLPGTLRLAPHAEPLAAAPNQIVAAAAPNERTPAYAPRYACGQCQSTIRPNTKFCPSCGAAL